MGDPDNYQWLVQSNSAFHSHTSSGSEQRIYEQHYSGSPQDMPSSFPMTRVQSHDSRGILIPDCLDQYPPQPGRLFIGQFYPGSPGVKYHFPVPQPVPAHWHANFPPMGSGAPSDDSMPPSFSPAPPVHLVYPPTPSAFMSARYDPRRVMFSVPPRGVDIQPQPVSVPIIGPVGHVQPSHSTTSMLRQKRTSAAPRKTHPDPSKPKPLVHCPVCGVPSKRRQERDRHLLSHLPCWIACSIGPCLWRGHRFDMFTKHLFEEHQTTKPQGHWFQLYNKRPFVNGLVKRTISIEDAQQRAVAEVEAMALVIGEQEFLKDPWGRKGKKGSQ
ncbi:hypothetical protein EDB86DRAFT_2829143 [Lactarius hatsudake]|nr:hypothetical protein EDB86DRAFT_2829143 [Lactarius hatsudake]